MNDTVKSEVAPEYGPTVMQQIRVLSTEKQDSIIEQAMTILSSRMRNPGEIISSPDTMRNYLSLRFAELEHEEFHLILLDNRHRVISCEFMFRGTIDGASVYPREVVKEALKHNAAAVVLAHNHPSGVPEPSTADISLTRRLVEALALVDCRVLDHIVVGGTESVSFAERGLI